MLQKKSTGITTKVDCVWPLKFYFHEWASDDHNLQRFGEKYSKVPDSNALIKHFWSLSVPLNAIWFVVLTANQICTIKFMNYWIAIITSNIIVFNRIFLIFHFYLSNIGNWTVGNDFNRINLIDKRRTRNLINSKWLKSIIVVYLIDSLHNNNILTVIKP